MRIRTTVAAVSGAIALSALAVPVAQADEAPGVLSTGKIAKTAKAKAGVGAADQKYGDTAISNVVVNGGKAVVFGPTTKKTIKVSFTVTDNSGVNMASVLLYRGSNVDSATGGLLPDAASYEAKCTKVTSKKSNCVSNFTAKADVDLYSSWAGSWKVWALAQGKDYDFVEKDNVRTFQILRDTNLTTDATPEPVKKGKTLTVSGKLTRAHWDKSKYEGYTGQSVKLQFKKKGSSAYTTVKTVKTGTDGAVKTTVKASADGTYRYVFSGSANAGSVSAKGDVIDVQ